MGGGRSRGPFGASYKQQEPGVNVVPFVIAILFVGIIVFSALPNTWIGQLMKQGPRVEDPIDKMTYLDARNTIESELARNIAAVGGQGKIIWQSPGDEAKPADKTVDGAINMTIDATLPSPELRKQIIDPVKPYMEKAKLSSLVMTDKKSHATWTYSVTPGTSPVEPDAGLE